MTFLHLRIMVPYQRQHNQMHYACESKGIHNAECSAEVWYDDCKFVGSHLALTTFWIPCKLKKANSILS